MMQTIPNFPDSKKLTLEDKDEIENFVRKFPPYSDYNFTSLYCYNVNDKVQVSWLNDNLVVLFQDYTSDEMFYSFLGDNLVTETALTLLNYSERGEIKKELRLIPFCTRNILDGYKALEINEDKNNHDYILSPDAIHTFKGNIFKEKRKSVNKFLKKYPNQRTNILDLSNSITKRELIELYQIWIDGKKVSEEKAKHELSAFKRLVSNSEYLNVVAFGVYIEERLVAFNIIELLTNNYALSHFGKYDVTIDGAFTFILRETAKYLNDKNYTHLNYEQDLGIDGLRVAKQELRPTAYLKKFIITKK